VKITAQEKQGTLVVELQGELDHHAVETIRDDIDQELRRTHYAGLVMSFRNIDFMDSSALGLILGRYRTMSQHQGRMALCEVNPSLRKIFELSGILKILPLFDSEVQALQYVKEG